MTNKKYDVVIVGAGISGSLIARQLGLAGKRVLILEAGAAVPPDRAGYMQNFYTATAKTPESPYPPTEATVLDPGSEATPRATILGLVNFTDPQKSYLVQPAPDPAHQATSLPFSSTYERVGGGTTWHWLGTSLRLVPDDITMKSKYDPAGNGDWTDWPIAYEELETLYGQAESDVIGVAASVAQQAPLEQAIGMTYPPGYQYPMNPIPESLVDQSVSQGVSGMDFEQQSVFVTPTPQGRNSQPFQNRRTCAGNTNCIPICPIQAKYDATYTLAQAQNTGNVDVWYQTVVNRVNVDANGRVESVSYIQWDQQLNPTKKATGTVSATLFVLAAHAMETPRLLLMSATDALPNGVANSSGYVGACLMDHVIYLSWALAPQPIFPYRGPLSTSGIESLRTGPFRSTRSSFRIEIGNEGWNWAVGDPWSTTLDLINGTNVSQTNPFSPPGGPPPTAPQAPQVLAGVQLAQALNDRLTRQFRLGFLIEQTPMKGNRVELDPQHTDGLGLPRPRIVQYEFDEYVLNGFRAAKQLASSIYQRMGATEYTNYSGTEGQAGYFLLDGEPCRFFGAGHIIGTYRMGADPKSSVVNADQRSWDHENLWLVGSGVFPTEAAANPTLTIVALTLKAAEAILKALA